MAVQPPIIDISASSVSTQAKNLSSSHRLPTVSASQALQDLKSSRSGSIASGLQALDSHLAENVSDGFGGYERGKLTELWGPNGAGKTAIALEAASNALKDGHKVLWVDTSTSISGPRLQSVADRVASQSNGTDSEELLRRFQHVTVPTLSHLLALVLHPRPGFPADETGLLVIRRLNTLIDADYPRFVFSNSKKTEQQRWQAGRRYAVLGSLATSLNKFAVINNLAVLITTGCASRQRAESELGAALVPGIGGAEWDVGVWNRIVTFRDFNGRFVGLQKCQGRSLISRQEVGELGTVVGFGFAEDGSLQERRPAVQNGGGAEQAPSKIVRSPVKPRKRAFDEIADSDEEDADEYGWAEIDEDTLAAEGLGAEQTSAEVIDVG